MRTVALTLSVPLIPLFAAVVGCGSSSRAAGEPDAATDGAGQGIAIEGDGGDESDPSRGDGASVEHEGGAGCPLSAPGAASSCPVIGVFCSYGGGICCGGAYTCATGGSWQVVSATCQCNVGVTDGGSVVCGDASCTTPDYCFQPTCSAGTPLPDAGQCQDPAPYCGPLASGCTADGGDSFWHSCDGGGGYLCSGVNATHKISCMSE